MSSMISQGEYVAPSWLPGGHAQTIVPAKLMRTAAPPLRRERWTTPDNDFIDVDFLAGSPNKPFLVLFHGLEGSSQSHYARSLMQHLVQIGWSAAIPHFRGCSGELNLAPRFYHSGMLMKSTGFYVAYSNIQHARIAHIFLRPVCHSVAMPYYVG